MCSQRKRRFFFDALTIVKLWQLFPSIHAVIPLYQWYYQWSCTTTLMLSTKDNTTFDNRTKTLLQSSEAEQPQRKKGLSPLFFPLGATEKLLSTLYSYCTSLFSLHTQSIVVALQKQGSYEYKCVQSCIIIIKRSKNNTKSLISQKWLDIF